MGYSISVGSTTLQSQLDLTQDQCEALQQMIKFMYQVVDTTSEETYLLTLSGSAGTGKTSLLKLLIQYNKKMRTNQLEILGAALTHKARRILHNCLNNNAFKTIPTMTISKLLRKQKMAGYIGTKKYKGKGSEICEFDLIIIDESSMISDDDYAKIVKWAEMYGTKIIFIGDDAQIPHPVQKMVLYDGKLEKADSASFRVKNHLFLKTVVRQAEDNPVLSICQCIRSNVRATSDLYPKVTKLSPSDGSGVVFTGSDVIFTEEIGKYFSNQKNPRDLIKGKIIVYTNKAVDQYNKSVRTLLHGPHAEIIQKGDILMGYENVGFPAHFIENGQDYLVQGVRYVTNQQILNLGLASGYLTILQSLNLDSGDTKQVFFPDVDAEENYTLLQELIKRAQLVNAPNSTIAQFKNYQGLKDQLLFLESIYLWNNEILSESEFHRRHPYLRHRVVELITEEVIYNSTGAIVGVKRKLAESQLVNKIQEMYPQILMDRLRDTNIMGDSEELCDRYKILTHDLKYGMAITAHKSQASTYEHVFIDETDFDKIQDRWSYKDNIFIRGSKERNQLKYVAFSRASRNATVLSKDLS